MNPVLALYNRLPDKLRRNIRTAMPKGLLRWYAHRNTDVYLLSYPKCGRTWLRLMVGRAISLHFALPEEEDILFLRTNRRLHAGVPRITVVHDDHPMLKTPQELEQSKERYRNKKVIFLVRDPRDVIVSSYFEMMKRSELFGENPHEERKAVFQGSLSEFICMRQGGFDTILEYYNIWARNRGVPRGFLLVRYEDMKEDPRRELRRVLGFVDLSVIPDEIINQAVEYASFENMRKMEAEGRFHSGILKPADQADRESYKTRRGRVRGYLEYLSEQEVQWLNQKMQTTLSPFYGYWREE